jgi:hypothetical protein
MVAQEEDLEAEVVKETEIGKEGGGLVPEIETGIVSLGIGDIVPEVDLERGGEIDRDLETERKIGNIAIVTTRDHLEIVIVTEKIETEIGRRRKTKKNRRLDRDQGVLYEERVMNVMSNLSSEEKTMTCLALRSPMKMGSSNFNNFTKKVEITTVQIIREE